MKKILCCMLCLMFCFPYQVDSESDPLTPQAASSVLMDYESGQILHEKNMHEKLYPASMTKMMSLYLVMKAVHQGKISWQDMVYASEHAASMGGSQIYLEAGEQMSVLDLFKASTVASANDAITALAEKVSGSESAFVDLMNETAASFGCTDTHFVNPTGLHDPQHVSSAFDMAVIARKLIEEGSDELLQYTSMMEDYIREDSDQKFWLVNTNKMLRSYQGMDGLKTGYTSDSLYCITVTACRDGFRLIGVVMREPDKKTRSLEASALLDYGFSNFERKVLLKEYELEEWVRVTKGIPEIVSLTNSKELAATIKRGQEIQEVSRSIVLNDLHAPVVSGQKVGELVIELNNGQRLVSDLCAKQDSEEMAFWTIFVDCMKKILF